MTWTGKLSFNWPGGAINPSNAESPVDAHLFERGYGLSLLDNVDLPLVNGKS